MKTHKVIVSLDMGDITVHIHEINQTYDFNYGFCTDYDYTSPVERLQADEIEDRLVRKIEYHFHIRDKQKLKNDIQKIIEA